MSDTSGLFGQFGALGPLGYFRPGDDKNVPQALRQRLALALLAQKKKYPTTLGEGLSAIGDSLGDIGMMRRIEGEAATAEQAGQAAYDKATGGGGAAPSASPPPPAAANVAPTSLAGGDPTSQAPVPSIVQEGAPLKGMAIRPGINMPPAKPMMQGSASINEPIRTNPDGSIAGNLSSPQVLPPPGGPPPGQQPQPPGWTTDKQFNELDAAATPPAPPRPSVADYGQKLALAPTPPPGAPPVMASDARSLSPQADQQRRAVGLAMLKQQMGGQGAPVPPQAMPPPTPPAPGIAAAPPATPPIRSMPPPQMAQAVPPAGYVTPPQADPTPPPTQTPKMQQLQNIIRNTPASQRDSVAASLAPLMADEQAKLAQENVIYQDKMKQAHEMRMERERQSATATGRVDEHAIQVEAATKAANENKLRAQFANLPPEDVIKQVVASKAVAKSGADALVASQAAMDAFKKGAITGYGAEKRLDVAKLFTALGLTDKHDVIANTETFRNAMQPVVAAILHQTSGTSQLSEGELAFAKQAAAGNITLDAHTIERLMPIIDKRSREVIKDHQTLTGALFGDEPRAKAIYGVEMPKTKDDDALEWAAKNPNDPRAATIRQRLGR